MPCTPGSLPLFPGDPLKALSGWMGTVGGQQFLGLSGDVWLNLCQNIQNHP